VGENGAGVGHFNHPKHVVVDRDHNIYVGEYKGKRVQTFDSVGNYLLTFSPPTSEGFGNVWAIKVDCNGIIWVVDSPIGNTQPYTGRILTYRNDGTFISLKKNIYARDIEVDIDGNVYVMNMGNNRMERYDGNFDEIDSYALNARWVNMALDCNGKVYVTEGTDGLSIWTKDGEPSDIHRFGQIGTGESQFGATSGIFIDGPYAYITDWTRPKILKFNLNNGCVDGPGPFALACPLSSTTSTLSVRKNYDNAQLKS